jgi:FkbM family methyltransferase
LYGAGLYRLLGGSVPVVALYNRELTAWPENVSSLLSAQVIDTPFIAAKKKLRAAIERYGLMHIANAIDLHAFTNPVLRDSYRDFGMVTDGKSVVLGDPYDYHGLMQANGLTEQSYVLRNKASGPITLFYSSRMAPGKGFDLLVTAFSKLKNKQDFKLVLGGSGPEEEAIHALVERLGVGPYVQFTGWMSKEELYQRLKEADIFIQAAWRRDMTSMALSTAMVFGLPNILPGGGGLEWVASGGGLYFTEGDTDDLARKIEQLGSDRSLRERLSQGVISRINSDEMNYNKQITVLHERMKVLVVGSKGQTSTLHPVVKKIRVLAGMNWPWAYRHYKKKALLLGSFYYGKATGQEYYQCTVDGLEFKLSTEHPYHHLFAEHVAHGKHEATLLSLWKKQAVEIGGGVIFDVGGYNGMYGLVAALANPLAQIVIFEPEPVNVSIIEKNIKLNNITNAKVVASALSGSVGTVSFRKHTGATSGRIEEGTDTLQVPTTTISAWAREHGQVPRLLKFDIGGAEAGALLAADDILATAPQMGILLEFYPGEAGAQGALLWQLFERLGYQTLFLYQRGDKKSKYYFVYKGKLSP